MILFKDFRRKAGNFFLTKRLKKLIREKTVINLNSAKTAALIFTATEETDWLENKSFIDYLKEREIKLTVLAFLKNKKLKHYYDNLNKVNFFSVEDLNWSYIPKPAFLKAFLEKEYDLLIDLDTEHNFATSYITALSRAHFKVGLKHDEKNYYDLMIDMGNLKNKEEYLNHVKHYLTIINN